MATPMIKTTYSLDAPTVQDLESLAEHWGVSKSGALRRAIQAVAREQGLAAESRVQAFRELQDSLGLTEEAAAQWQQEVLRERRSGRLGRVGSEPSKNR